jgi:hypothetical protein
LLAFAESKVLMKHLGINLLENFALRLSSFLMPLIQLPDLPFL